MQNRVNFAETLMSAFLGMRMGAIVPVKYEKPKQTAVEAAEMLARAQVRRNRRNAKRLRDWKRMNGQFA